MCGPTARCSCSPAMSGLPAPAPTSSAATPMCRARPIWASMSATCRSITGWSRAPGGTGPVSGTCLTTISSRASTTCRPRPAAPRARPSRTWRSPGFLRRAGSTRRCSRRAGGPEGQHQGHVHHGPWRQHHSARARRGGRARQAGDAGRHRPASDELRFAPQPARRHLCPAGLHAASNAHGTRTASNRSLQWGEKIVEPIFESGNDYWIIYKFAQKLGFAGEMFKNIKLVKGKFGDEPEAESLLREINRGGWSTGYTGQSPERLKAHMANQDKFDIVSLRAPKELADVGGDYYGLPWPCWGKPEVRHPGTHILYNTNLRMMDGGGAFRPRFGLERNGETLLAQNSWNLEFADPGRLSGIHLCRLPAAGLGCRPDAGGEGDDRTDRRRQSRQRQLVDRSLGRHPARLPREELSAPSATARPAPSPGTCPIRCPCIASRSTRRVPTSSPNTRRVRTNARCACPISAPPTRRARSITGSPRASRSS